MTAVKTALNENVGSLRPVQPIPEIPRSNIDEAIRYIGENFAIVSGTLTDNAVLRGDGGGGGIQDSNVLIDDSDNITGVATLTLPNTGLHLLDTDASHDLIIAPGSDLSADRTLTVTTGDADRGLTLSGDLTVESASLVNQDLTTDASPQFTGVNIGHATDTTITRVSAGVAAIEGDTIATLTATQTLSNKTLTLPQINDTSSDHQYIFAVSELAADRTVTLPLLTGDDIFTFNDFAATLTNKTIDLGSNTLTGSAAEFDAAVQSDSFVFTSEIGSIVQAWDADLDSWAAITRAANFDTFVATPSSANLASLVTDETGSGALVFATSPTLVTPVLGTPASGNLSNCTSYPSATDSLSGIVELTTAAEVRAATTGKVLTTDILDSAAETVALSDGATVAVDWSAGINYTLTVTANRALGNPSNEEPGQYRTVLVQGNDGTSRTLTFGNEYGGTVPTLTDITSTQKYLLTIYCKSAGQFLVTSIDGTDA